MLAIVVGLAGCNDLRDFAGTWTGNRVGATPVLRVGEGVSAALTIDSIDKYGMRGHVVVEGATALVADADFISLDSAEADVLASMTFAGAPMRVYLAYVPMTDGLGDALAFIALYDSRRVELRLLRGAPAELYAIYALTET